MTLRVSHVARTCHRCQLANPQKINKTAKPLKCVQVPRIPSRQWGMDCIGPLPLSQGMQYVITAKDYTSKWVEAEPMPNKSAECIADFMWKLYCRWGSPKFIITDQGTEFKNNLCGELHRGMRIRAIRCSVYHPQSNGLVERQNATTERKILTACEDYATEWVRALPGIIGACNKAKAESTRFSPFRLMHGWEPRLGAEEIDDERDRIEAGCASENFQSTDINPMDINFGDSPAEMEELLEFYEEKRRWTYEKATEHQKKSHAYQAKQHNMKYVHMPLVAGMKVLKRNKQQDDRKQKLYWRFTGPYVIHEINTAGNAILMIDGKPTKESFPLEFLRRYWDDPKMDVVTLNSQGISPDYDVDQLVQIDKETEAAWKSLHCAPDEIEEQPEDQESEQPLETAATQKRTTMASFQMYTDKGKLRRATQKQVAKLGLDLSPIKELPEGTPGKTPTSRPVPAPRRNKTPMKDSTSDQPPQDPGSAAPPENKTPMKEPCSLSPKPPKPKRATMKKPYDKATDPPPLGSPTLRRLWKAPPTSPLARSPDVPPSYKRARRSLELDDVKAPKAPTKKAISLSRSKSAVKKKQESPVAPSLSQPSLSQPSLSQPSLSQTSDCGSVTFVREVQMKAYYRPLTVRQRVAVAKSAFNLNVSNISFKGVNRPGNPARLINNQVPVTGKVDGDGACFFRAISLYLSNLQQYHFPIRMKVCEYISANFDQLREIVNDHARFKDGAAYIKTTDMGAPRTWATEVEIYATAGVMGHDIVVYDANGRWQRHCASGLSGNETRHAVYLANISGCHFEPVTSHKAT